MPDQERVQPEGYQSNCHPLLFCEKTIEHSELPDLVLYYERFPEYEVVLSYELWRTGRARDLYDLAEFGLFECEANRQYERYRKSGVNMICELGIPEQEYEIFLCDLVSIILKASIGRELEDDRVLSSKSKSVVSRVSKIMEDIRPILCATHN